MIKHKRVNLSLDVDVVNTLKKKTKNLSKYVENLVLRDIALNKSETVSAYGGSIPPPRTFFSEFLPFIYPRYL